MNLAAWATRQIRDVDTDGGQTHRIRLTSSEGMAWEVWERPFPEPKDWVAEADALLGELAAEWPARRIQVMFVAEDASGGVRAQCPKTITGKNRAASDMLGPESRALAISMEAQATTTERLLQSSNTQIGILTKTVETLGEQVHTLLEYITQKAENDALRAGETGSPELSKFLAEAMQQLPSFITMLDEAKRQKRAKANGKRKINGQQIQTELADQLAKETSQP